MGGGRIFFLIVAFRDEYLRGLIVCAFHVLLSAQCVSCFFRSLLFALSLSLSQLGPTTIKGHFFFLGPIKLMCNCLFLLSLSLVWPGRGMIGRGRGGFGGRGRGRGRGRGALTRPVLTKEQLDNQLDAYMSKTKGHLDAELDAYMAQTDPETND